MNISDLKFSTRVANCLNKRGIKTVEELCQLSDLQLSWMPNFGDACMREVRLKLASIGRALGSGMVDAPQPTRRYGIIPCRRCAFFARYVVGDDNLGQCQRFAPRQNEEGVVWPVVHEDHGCGDGLLREEAATLPPERDPGKEPKP